jgi:hypothetical protein
MYKINHKKALRLWKETDALCAKSAELLRKEMQAFVKEHFGEDLDSISKNGTMHFSDNVALLAKAIQSLHESVYLFDAIQSSIKKEDNIKKTANKTITV